MESRSDAVRLVVPFRHLPMRIRPAIAVTDEALFELCRINRELRVERTQEGDLIVMSPTGSEAGKRNFQLVVAFGIWAKQDGTGVGFDSSTGFALPNGAERSPDLAWVKKERWSALSAEQRQRFAPLCPDFVVELRSPSDDLRELQAKMQEYLDNGAALGWLIDFEKHLVYVYRPNRPVERLENPTALSGEPLLRGFTLELSALE